MNDEFNCPINRKTNELAVMRQEITLLKQEINLLKAWVRNLKLWAKTTLLVFSAFTALILFSQYVYTSSVEDLMDMVTKSQCTTQK
jgi:hypothetical protein